MHGKIKTGVGFSPTMQQDFLFISRVQNNYLHQVKVNPSRKKKTHLGLTQYYEIECT